VLSQTLKEIELIIIDGQSTDSTCALIAKHSRHISYWISEPDLGIYNAMNKGIEQASGEWVLFLGADDLIHSPDTLENILKEPPTKECDFIAGNIIYDTGKYFHPSFNWKMKFKNTLHHQGVLYNRRVFLNFRYNPTHQISGDYELNLKLYLNRVTHRIIHETISTCAAMGASHQINPTGYKEEINIRQKMILSHAILTALNTLTYIRFSIKRILLKVS